MVGTVFLCRTRKLGQCQNGNIQFLGHNFQISGNLADFLHAVFCAASGTHQLQIVNDDHINIALVRVLVDSLNLCLHFRDGNLRGVIQKDIRARQHLRRADQVGPVGIG